LVYMARLDPHRQKGEAYRIAKDAKEGKGRKNPACGGEEERNRRGEHTRENIDTTQTTGNVGKNH